jgi:hypothetical protein
MDGYNLTNATEWFQCCCDDDENENENEAPTEGGGRDNGFNNNNKTLIVGNGNCKNEELPLSSLALASELERLLKTMGPVTTFCATVPININSSQGGGGHNNLTTVNNFNRTKSLENLNFTEKRQLIASSLSLAEILKQGMFMLCMILGRLVACDLRRFQTNLT